MIERIREPAAMAARARALAAAGRALGFVPTMGALHRGHLSLVERARATCGAVVVSIFVNPLQFGPAEDFARYPRDLDADVALLGEAGCDAVFAPEAAAMYPPGSSTRVDNAALAARFEGAQRPGHFAGVLTVVAKLFHVVQPAVAFFGQKDAQQCALVLRMVQDLDFPLRVEVLPTVREPDGLALSSRNRYLGAAGRVRARALSRGLAAAEARFRSGETSGAALVAALRAELIREEGVLEDYAALVDPATFQDLEVARAGALLVVAARVDGTRLLDNAVLGGGTLTSVR